MQAKEELELKTLLTRKQFENLKAEFEDLVFVPQVNIYYASKNSDHYAFRIRVRNGVHLFTLKQKLDGKTMEYEKEFEGDFEQDKEIMDTLLQFDEVPPFKKLGEMITYRAVHDSGLAEICFDINFYNDNVDYEIEYEVKQEHDHINTFKEILNKANIELVENKVSKYKRFLKTLKGAD